MILDKDIEFKGDLKGFPIEIVQKLLEKQLEQGLEEDITVFEIDVYASSNSGGFDWARTSEGREFWYDVLNNKDFELFFTKYPKLSNPELTVKQSLVSLNVGVQKNLLIYILNLANLLQKKVLNNVFKRL